MSLITLDALKAGLPFDSKDVEIEGVGTFRVRVFTGAQRDEAARFFLDEERKTNLGLYYGEYKRLIVRLSLCDESGAALLPSDTTEQLKEADEVLKRLPNPVLEKLHEEAVAINGLGKDAVDDAAKNSVAGQT